MTEEEKKAADEAAKAQADAEASKKAEEEAAAKAAEDAIAAKDEEIAKLKEDRDNYKNVALKRLGKLPGDAEFLEGVDEKSGLTVEEQVKKTLLDREIARKESDKDNEAKRLARENAELKLALKNRPGGSMGGDSGSSSEVKDNVFSAAQIEELKARAKRLNADPIAFIQKAKDNLNRHS